MVLQLLLIGLGLVELLAGGQCVAMYSGDESEGDSVDSVVDVGVCVEEYFSGVGRD